MEPVIQEQQTIPETCQTCHLQTLSTYYFCPNCGTKLRQLPLSNTPASQLLLYAFSIVLPTVCFLLISKWKGYEYLNSNDTTSKRTGFIACVLLVLSTVITFWLAYSLAKNILQASVSVSSSMLEE